MVGLVETYFGLKERREKSETNEVLDSRTMFIF